jgi:hypothetical protein
MMQSNEVDAPVRNSRAYRFACTSMLGTFKDSRDLKKHGPILGFLLKPSENQSGDAQVKVLFLGMATRPRRSFSADLPFHPNIPTPKEPRSVKGILDLDGFPEPALPGPVGLRWTRDLSRLARACA